MAKALRAAYQGFSRDQDLPVLLATLKDLPWAEQQPEAPRTAERPLSREELHLVCFDFVWS